MPSSRCFVVLMAGTLAGISVFVGCRGEDQKARSRPDTGSKISNDRGESPPPTPDEGSKPSERAATSPAWREEPPGTPRLWAPPGEHPLQPHTAPALPAERPPAPTGGGLRPHAQPFAPAYADSPDADSAASAPELTAAPALGPELTAAPALAPELTAAPALGPELTAAPALGPGLTAAPAEGPGEPVAGLPGPARLSHQPAEFEPQPIAPRPSQTLAYTSEEEDYTVARVFYGTDRAGVSPNTEGAGGRPDWLLPTLLSAGLSMILLAVAVRLGPSRLFRGLAAVAAVATVILGVLTVYSGLPQGLAPRQTRRQTLAYGNERGESLQLGTCQVSIPRDHRMGELEAPSVMRLEFREDPERHVVLLDVTQRPADEFFADLKACVDRSQQKGAFVFIHGFNVTFEDAARRTAQMAYDLKFDGAPIFYSWPSQGKLSQYTVDETNVVWTEPHLKEFVTAVAERSGAEQIHLIAHSMGNRALTGVLRALSYRPDARRPKFSEVVLTAPDVDADVFKRDVAPRIVRTARRVTLYASSKDKALAYSKQVHGFARAGDSGRQLVVVPGIDTIDVSAVDTSLVGHSYYGSNDTVLADLFDLIHQAKPPEERKWLSPRDFGSLRYWVFRRSPLGTAAAPQGRSG